MARGAVRIPIYEQRTNPSGLGPSPRASAEGAGAGLAALGSALGNVADVWEKKQDADDRIAALKAVTESELSLQEHFTTLQNKARPGGAGITGDYIKAIDEYRAKALEGASGNYAKHFDLHFGNLRERLARGAMEWEVGESRRFHLQSIQDAADAAEKIVGADPSQFETHMGRLVNAIRNDARLTPKQRDDAQEYARKSLAMAAMQGEISRNPQAYIDEKSINDSGPWKFLGFEERQRALRFAAQEDDKRQDAIGDAIGSRIFADRDNMKALNQWRKRIGSEEFSGMDAKRRDSLEMRVERYQSHLLQKQEAAARRAEAAAAAKARADDAMWKSVTGLVQAGKVINPEFAQQAARQFRGTPYERALTDMMKDAPAATAFGSQPLAAQRAALSAMLAKGNGPQGWTPAEQDQYEKLSKAAKAAEDGYRDDPMREGLERGVVQELTPVDISNLAAKPEQMALRRDQAARVGGIVGRAVSPLTNEEATAFARRLQSLPPAERVRVLEQEGRAIGGADAMRALSAQIGDKHQTLATEMYLASVGMRTTAGRPLAELYARGVDALATGRAKIDATKETGTRATIAAALDGVYRTPQARDMALDVSLKTYAAMRADGDDDVERAIRLATGGIVEHNGAKIVKPYGWADGQFRDRVNAITEADIRAQGGESFRVGAEVLTAAQLAAQVPGARLQSAGAGRYVILSGGGYVRKPDGSEFVLTIR